MANLREAFEYASKNPNSDFAKNLDTLARSGALNVEAKKYGIDMTPFQQQTKPERTGVEKVADFTGGKEIAQGLGQALAQRGNTQKLGQAQSQATDVQGQLLQRIKEKKSLGQDTSVLEGELAKIGINISQIGGQTGQMLNPENLTGKQVIGDALQLATTVGTIGGLSGAGTSRTLMGKTIPGLTTQGTGVAQTLASKAIGGQGVLAGAGRGTLAGAGQGAVSGALFGTSQGLQDDLTGQEIAGKAVKSAIGGAFGGGILGGVVGGISGGLSGRALRKNILNDQIQSGEKTTQPIKSKIIQIAKEQGIDDTDIQFISSLKPQDKIKAKRMIDLAQEASVNKRSLERPIDVVGDSMLNRIKYIQTKNSISGKAVDETAKALKGNMVDAMPIRDRALALLEDAGVTANANGTPNWSKSIFNKTPELQNKIMKSLSDLPAGEIDAYDLHNFKKSIDEVVNYGVGGEGLKGKSANILKAIRNSADEVLDNSFDAYNQANTDYKTTRDVLELTQDLFGKKAGVSKERGGQLLRSVFSNNAQRPRVLQLIEQLDKTAKNYGGNFKDNLVDQALFSEILEDIYGTQATTSLQGQTARAIKGTQKVMAGLRDPLKGAGELLATTAEKSLGISAENKKKILSALLR